MTPPFLQEPINCSQFTRTKEDFQIVRSYKLVSNVRDKS